jgi:hypothetical protein
MKNIVKYIVIGTAILVVSTIWAPVSALASVSALPGGPFTAANPVPEIPTSALLGSDTQDFTFTWADGETDVLLQTDNASSKSYDFQLYAGTPGSGTFLGESTNAPDPTITFNALAGNYYIEVPGGSYSAVTTSAVPEPGAWLMMLAGFAVLGVGLRFRPQPKVALARAPAPARRR